MLEHYVGTVEIEVNCMIQMLNQHIIPSVRRAGVGPTEERFQDAVKMLQKAMQFIHAEENLKKKAEFARMLRLEDMVGIRHLADEAEAVVPADLWTLSSYKDLLFLDQTTG
jgi:glutamine synthetase